MAAGAAALILLGFLVYAVIAQTRRRLVGSAGSVVTPSSHLRRRSRHASLDADVWAAGHRVPASRTAVVGRRDRRRLRRRAGTRLNPTVPKRAVAPTSPRAVEPSFAEPFAGHARRGAHRESPDGHDPVRRR